MSFYSPETYVIYVTIVLEVHQIDSITILRKWSFRKVLFEGENGQVKSMPQGCQHRRCGDVNESLHSREQGAY